MTIATQAREKDFVAQGGGATVPISFPYAKASDLVVVPVDADGVEGDPLTLNSAYSISGDGRTTAGVLTEIGLTAGADYRVRRKTALEQKYEPKMSVAGNASAMENQLDDVVMAQIDARGDVVKLEARAPLVPAGKTAPPLDVDGLEDGDLLEYRSGKLARKDLSAAAGKFAAIDGQGHIVGVDGSLPTGVPAEAIYIATDGGGNVQGKLDASAIAEARVKMFDLAQMGVNSDTAYADRVTAFNDAIDAISTAGGGTAFLSNLGGPLGLEGDVLLLPNVSILADNQPLVIDNGGLRIDGADYGAHIPLWTLEVNVTRTGSPGPAIFMGGDDTVGANKAAIRGRLSPRILGSTGVGIELANAYILDIIAPSIRSCADEAVKFAYGPQGITSANAVCIFGGELQDCGRGYTAVGTSGVFWFGTTIEGNDAACLIGTNTRDFGHYGGYFERNGTSGYDVEIGDSGSSPAHVFFDGPVFSDGDGASKSFALKLVKCAGLAVRNIRAGGYATALMDFQPASGGAVTGGWSNITGIAATNATPNRFFRPFSRIDRVAAASLTVSPGTVNAASTKAVSIAVANAAAASLVDIGYAQSLGNCDPMAPACRVAGTVEWKIRNPTAGNIALPDFTATVVAEDARYFA